MSLSRLIRCTVPLAFTLFVPHPLTAQATSRQLFIEIDAGESSTKAAHFQERGAVIVDLLLGLTLKQHQYVSLFAAAFAGATEKGGSDLTCELVRSSNGGIYCAPLEPTYEYAGGLLGVKTDSHRLLVALMGGPAFANSLCQCKGNPDTPFDGRAFGIQTRSEVNLRMVGPVWFTVSGQMLFLPNIRGKELRVQGVNAGLRVQ